MIKETRQTIQGMLMWSGWLFMGMLLRYAFLQAAGNAAPIDDVSAMVMKALYGIMGMGCWGIAYGLKDDT